MQRRPVRPPTAGKASPQPSVPAALPRDVPSGAAKPSSDVFSQAKEAPAPADVEAGASSPRPSGGLLRNMLLALGAIVAVTAFLGVLAARRRPEERP